MKNYKKGSTTLLIIIGILLIIAAVAYFIIQKGQTIPTSYQSVTAQQNSQGTSGVVATSSVSGWSTYVNTQFGFTFMYPSNFGVDAISPAANGAEFQWEIRPTKSLDSIEISVYSNATTLKSNLTMSGCSSTPTTFGSSGAAALFYTCKSSVATQKYYVALTGNNALTVGVIHDSGQSGLGLSDIPSDTINQIYSSFTTSQ